MSDNGAAMLAAETAQGLETLGVIHETTLAQSPYQNGKQEAFWRNVEQRLFPMLEGVEELTLPLLNDATQAWVELEYNQKPHQALGVSPRQRYLEGPEVGRPCPGSETLRDAFRLTQWRTLRRSDLTVSIEGRRFEVPARFRQRQRLPVCYARWDLAHIDLVDPRTRHLLAPLYPEDKQRNAERRRRRLTPLPETPQTAPASPSAIAPLLQQLIDDYAATGLPPAYLTQTPSPDDEETDR